MPIVFSQTWSSQQYPKVLCVKFKERRRKGKLSRHLVSRQLAAVEYKRRRERDFWEKMRVSVKSTFCWLSLLKYKNNTILTPAGSSFTGSTADLFTSGAIAERLHKQDFWSLVKMWRKPPVLSEERLSPREEKSCDFVPPKIKAAQWRLEFLVEVNRRRNRKSLRHTLIRDRSDREKSWFLQSDAC